MKLIFCPLFAVLFAILPRFSLAEDKGKKAKRKPSNDQVVLAQSTFRTFLRCGADPKNKDNEDELLKCMSATMTSAAGPQATRYSALFHTGAPISEAGICDRANQNLVDKYEQHQFELCLCFKTESYTSEKTGFVFFRLEKGMLKISKIKW